MYPGAEMPRNLPPLKSPQGGDLGLRRLSELRPDLTGIRRTARFLSLQDLLLSSKSELHQTVAVQSTKIARDGEIKKTDPRIFGMGIAIRALDIGMQDLPLDLRMAFLFNLSANNELFQHDVWFPSPEDLYLDYKSAINRNKERYERFLGYFDELLHLSIARPNILLAIRGDEYIDRTAGMFTEYDYWAEHTVLDNVKTLPTKTKIQMARSVPPELNNGYDPVLNFDNSLRKLRDRFGLLRDFDITQETITLRKDSIRRFIAKVTEDEFVLTKPIKEIARELGIPYATAHNSLERLITEFAAEKKTLRLPERAVGVPSEQTIQLAALIVRAISELDRPGHMWKYGQYAFTDVHKRINKALENNPELAQTTGIGSFVSFEAFMNVVKLYMFTDSPYSNERITKITRHDDAQIRAAIKEDIVMLLNNGFPKDAAKIRDRLHLVTEPSTRMKRWHMKRKVTEILAEINQEGAA